MVVAQKTPFAIARDSVKPLVLRGADGEPLIGAYFSGVAILSNGNIVFVEQYESRIAMFDSTGKQLASAGRKGAGPGEFENASRIMRYRGDSIALFDGSLRRISIFDSRLKFVRTVPVISPPAARAFMNVHGMFADGSIVSVATPYMSVDAATGVHTFKRTLVVAEPDGKFRQLPLPTQPEFIWVSGNTSTQMNAQVTSVQAIAVCERGFVVMADSVVRGYDTAFRPLFTSPYRGYTKVLTAEERKSHVRGDPAMKDYDKYREALDAAMPKRLVQYHTPVVSSDGMIWYKLGEKHQGRFVRTTPRGVVLDTVLAPYHVFHANGRTSVASGPFAQADDDAPTVLIRQPATGKARMVDPVSPLGRCNAARDY